MFFSEKVHWHGMILAVSVAIKHISHKNEGLLIICICVIFKPTSTKLQAEKNWVKTKQNNDHDGILLRIKSATEGDCMFPLTGYGQSLEHCLSGVLSDCSYAFANLLDCLNC